MAKALTYARNGSLHPLEYVRGAVVTACAMALIAAGQAMPL